MVYIETTGRKQKATLWAAGTESTSIGQKKVLAAVEIDVRWEEKQQDALNEQGETIRVDALVVVGQDIAVGSLMWLGELADWSAATGNLKEVVAFSKIPSLKGTRFRRTVSLVRYSESLPPIQV